MEGILVDPDYEHYLTEYNWYPHRAGRITYAVTHDNGKILCNGRKHILLHRLIMDFPTEKIDHKNGNGLDNRRSNLRLATHRQNKWNVPKYRNNTSGYKGVTWDKVNKKWRAQIKVDGKSVSLGRFTNVLDASAAYENVARELHGEFYCASV